LAAEFVTNVFSDSLLPAPPSGPARRHFIGIFRSSHTG
jgi:hypothetical protein